MKRIEVDDRLGLKKKSEPAEAKPATPDFGLLLDGLIRDAQSKLCAAVYVNTIEEARAVLDVLRNDAHVMRALREMRDELEFLLRRRKDIANG